MRKFALEYEVNGKVSSEEIKYMADMLDRIRLLLGDGVPSITVIRVEESKSDG